MVLWEFWFERFQILARMREKKFESRSKTYEKSQIFQKSVLVATFQPIKISEKIFLGTIYSLRIWY